MNGAPGSVAGDRRSFGCGVCDAFAQDDNPRPWVPSTSPAPPTTTLKQGNKVSVSTGTYNVPAADVDVGARGE